VQCDGIWLQFLVPWLQSQVWHSDTSSAVILMSNTLDEDVARIEQIQSRHFCPKPSAWRTSIKYIQCKVSKAFDIVQFMKRAWVFFSVQRPYHVLHIKKIVVNATFFFMNALCEIETNSLSFGASLFAMIFVMIFIILLIRLIGR